LLAGCVLGPEFERPVAPVVAGYISDPTAMSAPSVSTALGDSQNIVERERINAYWWRELGLIKLTPSFIRPWIIVLPWGLHVFIRYPCVYMIR